MAKKASKPIPEGMNTVTTYLAFSGNCRSAIEYYQNVFDAKLAVEPVEYPESPKIMHAMLRIGDTHIMMSDVPDGEWEQGPVDSATAGFWVYVEDCDLLYNKLVESKAEVLIPIMDSFWGDRMGKVKDPFGHCWMIASFEWELTPEEIAEGRDEWLGSVAQQWL